MIVVIADDFTGAAELGGIAVRHQLNVEVNTEVNMHSSADVLIIATDARSLTKKEAVNEMSRITKQVASLKPQLIFKKVDSVLRGYVIDELTAQLQILGLSSVLLVPANPALGRTVVDGKYFVNGEPLHLTGFANDPAFPAKTSSVQEMLHRDDISLTFRQPEEELAAAGITFGETKNKSDLQTWANKTDGQLLLAGGAGFFSAVLKRFTFKDHVVHAPKEWNGPALVICGTAFKQSNEATKKLKQQGLPVSYMPAGILKNKEVDEDLYKVWCAEIVSFIQQYGKAIIAVDDTVATGITIDAGILRNQVSLIVKKVFEQVAVNELLIEGGSTAFAVLKALNMTRFYPFDELATGVVRMAIADHDNLSITIKPGSYHWPLPVKQTILN